MTVGSCWFCNCAIGDWGVGMEKLMAISCVFLANVYLKMRQKLLS